MVALRYPEVPLATVQPYIDLDVAGDEPERLIAAGPVSSRQAVSCCQSRQRTRILRGRVNPSHHVRRPPDTPAYR